MTIVYDIQATQSIHHGERGIARYVIELARAIEQTRPGLVAAYALNPDLPIPAAVADLERAGRIVAVDDPLVDESDVYHVGSPMENAIPIDRLLPPAHRLGGRRLVATVYDLIPLHYPDEYLHSEVHWAEYGRGLALMRTADHVLAISATTAEDVHERLGVHAGRVTVIGGGAGPQFRPLAAGEHAGAAAHLALVLPHLRHGYVLVPTGIDFRKNLDGTIDAYAALPADLRHRHQLVVTCRVDQSTRDRLDARCRHLGVEDDVLLTGYVEDDDLVRLYQLATLVVFPSLFEGFGLPPLEARRCGTPVICGDNSSLREVITDARARFRAEDPAAIAAAMGHALSDRAFLDDLRHQDVPPLTWDHAARLTAEVYERLEAEAQHDRRRTVPVAALQPRLR